MLIRHTLYYMPAQIIGPAAQFVTLLVFTHWLAPEPYGIFTYVIASQDFVFLLCLSWWSQYTIRYFGGHAQAADERYRDAELTILLGTIVPQVVASLLAIRLVTADISLGLAASATLYTVTRCLNLHLGERARARSHFLDYTLATAGGPLAGLALAVLAVAHVAATPVAGLFGFALAQGGALVLLMVRQDMRLVLRAPDRALLRQALMFGLPLIAAGLAAWLGINAIRIVVDHRMGAGAMGLIAVGWSLGHRITTTASMLVTLAAFPLAVESFRRGAREAAVRQITTNGLLMFGIALPTAVGLYLLQHALVTVLVAAPFRATTIAILPAALAAGLCRNIRTHVADQVFVLIERTSMVFVMTMLETVAVVIGCVVGLAHAGAVGAAYGSAAGYGVAMVVSFIVARAIAGLRLPLLDAGLVVLAVAVMALIVELLPGREALPGGAVAWIAFAVIVGMVAYAAAILALFPVVTRGAWARWKQLAAR